MSGEFKSVDEIQREQREKGEEFAKELEGFANTFNDEKMRAAAKYLANRSHRYGQTQVMRLFLMLCEEMAANHAEGRYDGRNQLACDIAASIADQHKPGKLPR
jgi:hypothetical protein